MPDPCYSTGPVDTEYQTKTRDHNYTALVTPKLSPLFMFTVYNSSLPPPTANYQHVGFCAIPLFNEHDGAEDCTARF